MQGSLGEKVGEGASADVHAWAPGQVVKLFRSGVPRRLALHELRMTRAVFAAGVPAPEAFALITVNDRHGLVMSRLDGPTLKQLSQTGAMTHRQVGAILATLALSVHRTPPPPDMFLLRDDLEARLRVSGGSLPEHIAERILPLIARLAPGDGLCHGDLHTGNVIMTARGARLIDWTGATRGPAALDLAISHVVLAEIAPEMVLDPERPRAVNAALQSEYAGQSGISATDLAAAVDPYLSVARVLALLAGGAPGQKEQLIQRVEASLNSLA